MKVEGPNDGLTSVFSSKWGDYQGTLEDVSHMDMINWPNRLKWTIDAFFGRKPKYVSKLAEVFLRMSLTTLFARFNAIAFYYDIAGMYHFRKKVKNVD